VVVQLVVMSVLQHPVRVDARLVGERIVANPHLVDGQWHTEGVGHVVGQFPGNPQVGLLAEFELVGDAACKFDRQNAR